jgi:putative hemolysin
MFAIGVLFSLSLFSKPNPPVAQQSAELEKLAHLTQVQEIAMCSDVHENRLIPASNVKAGGKLYLNDRAHAAVLHICVLPKIKKTENYTVWCIEKNGNTTAIKTIRGGTEMSEVNFIISNLLELHEDMHFQLTRELSAKPQAPSAAVLLKI